MKYFWSVLYQGNVWTSNKEVSQKNTSDDGIIKSSSGEQQIRFFFLCSPSYSKYCGLTVICERSWCTFIAKAFYE